jgi:transposase InsO family protein
VRIAFTLDCCDREAISWVATTGSINSSDIRDLMIESLERRFGLINKLRKADRVAVRQRLALHRRRDTRPGARYRLGAAQ